MRALTANAGFFMNPVTAAASPLILLIEDAADIADIIQAYLQRDGYRTAYAQDGQHGMALFRQQQPDLVLLDIGLPGQNGVDVLQAIRSSGDVPVIMLTAMTDDINKVLSLRLGADDYITKPFNPVEVVARVSAVLRRTGRRPVMAEHGAGGGEELIRCGVLEINQTRHAALVRHEDGGESALPLTLTEFRLLALMAGSPRRCFSRFELIEFCMPESDALDRVVDSHLSKLRRKLQEAGCSGLIETVRGVGYRLWPDH